MNRASFLGEAYKGFKKRDGGKYKPRVERPKRAMKPNYSRTNLNEVSKSKNALCLSVQYRRKACINSYFFLKPKELG